MKFKQTGELALCELVTGPDQVGGADQAETMVRVAIDTPLVASREQPRWLIFSAKGRSV
jgi:hypothetical protein